MRVSRALGYSAVCACVVHICALGFAARTLVALPQERSQLVRVTLSRPAAPLPVGNSQAGANATPASLAKAPEPIAPPPRSRVKPKPAALAPRRPAVIATPAPVSSPPSLPRLPLPLLVGPVTEDAESATGGVDTTRSGGATGEGDGNGTGEHRGIGSGDGEGTLARPAYGINPKPPYPLLARRLGAQGVVVVRVHVREDGSVASVELARSSGFTLLDESAQRTIRERWRFIPARRDGTPVASWVEVPIRFVLEGS